MFTTVCHLFSCFVILNFTRIFRALFLLVFCEGFESYAMVKCSELENQKANSSSSDTSASEEEDLDATSSSGDEDSTKEEEKMAQPKRCHLLSSNCHLVAYVYNLC